MEPLIQTVDLKKHFKVNGGMLHAVDGVSISIPRGGTLGVVGESGCGKSTLGRLILRLLPATSGEVYFENENILNYSKQKLRGLRAQMQIIFQDPYSSLNPRMSVFELIGEPLIMNHACANRKECEKRILELMDTVGLARRFVSTYPHEMDGGRRQRVGVARALALNPKFIVCDEPVSALDVSIQAQILNLLMDLQDEINLTYMFITHDLLVVRHIADEIAVMYLGQCVEKAPAKELFINPCHPYTRALLAAIPIPKLQDKKDKVLLHGEVSDPINPRPGCRFYNRCVSARSECQEMDYDLREISPGHFVSCFLYR
ncbi:MAG: oligopeptide/dipeptide ABC transporter ATP-binding protein [Dethiobacteria bacterium]|nr:oligopeptide/dipeptide ABC transporter ATP-binding protein [Dethiobacteria bacterium]